jgi:hypothetical protein
MFRTSLKWNWFWFILGLYFLESDMVDHLTTLNRRKERFWLIWLDPQPTKF